MGKGEIGPENPGVERASWALAAGGEKSQRVWVQQNCRKDAGAGEKAARKVKPSQLHPSIPSMECSGERAEKTPRSCIRSGNDPCSSLLSCAASVINT
jgi:hypothetical protein